MAILVTCECGKQFQTGDEYAGRRARCPDCGRELVIPSAKPYDAPHAKPPDLEYEPRTSGKAIASLVLGLSSFFCTLFTGIPAIIFGAIAQGEIKGSQGRLKGQGMALSGIIMGALACTLVPIGILVGLLLPAVSSAREAGRRTQCQNNMRQIGLALINFANSKNYFPPAAISDPDGKPLLSWRVAILPYLDQADLYNQFKLDEPWDSPHNLALLAQMPSVYRCPNDGPAAGQTMTRYLAVSGPHTIFDGAMGVSYANIRDGVSMTLLVVEVGTMVPWTKPEDLYVDPTLPPPTLASAHPGGTNAVFADGAVRFLKNSVSPEILRALFTRDGGEVIDASAF